MNAFVWSFCHSLSTDYYILTPLHPDVHMCCASPHCAVHMTMRYPGMASTKIFSQLFLQRECRSDSHCLVLVAVV